MNHNYEGAIKPPNNSVPQCRLVPPHEGHLIITDSTRLLPRRSIVHDVQALERIARVLARKVHGKLQCEGATTLMSIWWAPVGAAFSWPVAVWVRARLSSVFGPKMDKIY